MKTLKQEEVNGQTYRDVQHAKNAIRAFIEQVYNRQRCTPRWPTSLPPSSKHIHRTTGCCAAAP